MGVALFAALDVVGTIGRLVVLRLTGKLLANPIGWLLDLIAQYRIPLLVVSVSLVGFTVFRDPAGDTLALLKASMARFMAFFVQSGEGDEGGSSII